MKGRQLSSGKASAIGLSELRFYSAPIEAAIARLHYREACSIPAIGFFGGASHKKQSIGKPADHSHLTLVYVATRLQQSDRRPAPAARSVPVIVGTFLLPTATVRLLLPTAIEVGKTREKLRLNW
jgi:hypothetical protein